MTPENKQALERELFALELKEPKDKVDFEETKRLEAEIDGKKHTR